MLVYFLSITTILTVLGKEYVNKGDVYGALILGRLMVDLEDEENQ